MCETRLHDAAAAPQALMSMKPLRKGPAVQRTFQEGLAPKWSASAGGRADHLMC